MPKGIFFISILFCFLYGIESSKNSIDITSNFFSYGVSQNLVELSKNVQIRTAEYVFTSEKANMNLDTRVIDINEPFVIYYNNQNVKGKSLQMDSDRSLLTANSVISVFGKYTLYGENVIIHNSEVDMDKVLITTCQTDKPLVYLRSEKVRVYSQYGFIVAFNSFLHVHNVPILYFPAYFMGDRRYSAFAENNLVPEIGSNQVEGSYIKENLPYYMNATNHGSMHIGLIEKFGIKVGFQHYSVLNEGQQKSTFGLFYSPKTWQGNFLYTYALTEENLKDKYFLSFLFDEVNINKRKSNIYLSYGLKYNEVINNQFVTVWPSAKIEGYLDVNKNNDLNLSYELSQIEENSITKSQKITLISAIDSSYQLGLFAFRNKLSYIRNHYINWDMHERMLNYSSIGFPYSGIVWTADYEHMFLFKGNSPFLHDFYNIDTYDKIGLSAKIHINIFDIEYKIRKRLDSEFYYFRKIEVTLPYERCIDFKIFWEDVEKVFGISVQI